MVFLSNLIKNVRLEIKKISFWSKIAFLFVCTTFVIYGIFDLVTSAQTYHISPNRSATSVFLIIFIIALLSALFITFIENKSIFDDLIRNRAFLIENISIVSLLISILISCLIHKSSFTNMKSVLLYPSLALLIYDYFFALSINHFNKKYLIAFFFFAFTLYWLFFVFYFFYLIGKPTKGGGLRIPSLSHIFFLLSFFSVLRTMVNNKSLLFIYVLFIPLVILSGKMSVFLIALFFAFDDMSELDFFRTKKILYYCMIGTFFILIIAAFIYGSTTTDNFLADNFSISSLVTSGRLSNWANILPHIKEFKFIDVLFGAGPGATMLVNNGTAAHNDYIEYFFDYGIVGLLSFLSVLVSFVLEIKMHNSVSIKHNKQLLLISLITLSLVSAIFTNMNMFLLISAISFVSYSKFDHITDNNFYEVRI